MSFTTPKTWAFGEVLTSTDMNTYVRDNVAALMQMIEDIPVREKRIAAFTGSGTWTVPAGVTYAIAHIRGAGGSGGGRNPNQAGLKGGSSSVAFASGTVTAEGGEGSTFGTNTSADTPGIPGQPNSGKPGGDCRDSIRTGVNESGQKSGVELVAGAAVTPAATITVTVGAGGASVGGGSTTSGAGGSGYVWIEYFEEV